MATKLCLLLLLLIVVVILQEAVEGKVWANATLAGMLSTRSKGQVRANATLAGMLSTRSQRKRYSAYKEKLSWTQAMLFCRRRKKQLATILTEDDHDALSSEINRLAKMWEVKVNKFWIGGGVEGSDWVWANSGKQLRYVVWAKGQPKPKNLCLQINSQDDFNFVSGKCEDLSMFVCQN